MYTKGLLDRYTATIEDPVLRAALANSSVAHLERDLSENVIMYLRQEDVVALGKAFK